MAFLQCALHNDAACASLNMVNTMAAPDYGLLVIGFAALFAAILVFFRA